MDNSLFTVELIFVKNDEELEKIKAMYPKYDPYFIDSGCIKKRREKFDKLWQKFKPYADSHFLNQIKTNFHQRSWEMYVGNVLLSKKLSIKSQNEGPDFIVNSNIYIECTASTKGDLNKPDSVPRMKIGDQNVPDDQMILRITQVIKDKALDQYEKWKSKEWFDEKIPFIIAVNTGDLEYPEDPSMPNVVKALFGTHFMQINMKTGEISYSHRVEIKKSTNNPVSVNLFLDNSFSLVSGILFSNKRVLHHPDKIGDDCIFVNNPFANNPVDNSFVQFFKNWNASKDDNGINLKKNYK